MSLLVHNIRTGLFPRYPLTGSLEAVPFFIVGAPRSGTTLLRRILTASPGLHIPPETYVLGRVVRQWKRYQNLDWSDLATLVLSTFELHPRFDLFGLSLRPLLLRVKRWKGEQRNLAAIVDAIMRYHAEVNAVPCQRWADKTPAHSLAMPEIHALYPQARFIHMLRDGVDSIASWYARDIDPDIEVTAKRWESHVRAVGAFSANHPSLVQVLRYEELVTNPAPHVQRICEFVGLPYREEMLSDNSHVTNLPDILEKEHLRKAAQPIATDSLGRGRATLSSQQREIIQRIAGAELARWNYPAATS